MSNSELLAWPFFGYAPGNYTSSCMDCGAGPLHNGMDKRSLRCLDHAIIAAKRHIEALEEHAAATEDSPDRTQLDELRAENGAGPWQAVWALVKAADEAAEWINRTRLNAISEGTTIDTLHHGRRKIDSIAPSDRGKPEVKKLRAAIHQARKALGGTNG